MLEALFWDCFRGADEIHEDDFWVKVRPPPRGAVLAFKLDGKTFRKVAGLEGRPCADAMFMVLHASDGKTEARIDFWVLELKGGETDHALVQLESALVAFRGLLKASHAELGLHPTTFGRAKFGVVVATDHAAPVDLKQKKRDFYKRVKVQLHVVDGLRRGATAPEDVTEVLYPSVSTS